MIICDLIFHKKVNNDNNWNITVKGKQEIAQEFAKYPK